jgi:sugar O-acyltransferase (sialic acid O-acetyltransferase NeuD family)
MTVGSERDVLVCGTRTFALEVADVVEGTPGFRVVAFVENEDRKRCEQPRGGLPVHWVADVGDLRDSADFVCGLSTTHRSRFSRQLEEMGLRGATVVHPAVHVSPRSELGAGTVVLPGVGVGSHTRVGRHAILSRGVLVGHHTTIGDHATLSPGANVAGACRIGDSTYVGMGAIVLDGINVGEHAVVGAGAVVTRDVPDRVKVMGLPARVVEEGIDGL